MVGTWNIPLISFWEDHFQILALLALTTLPIAALPSYVATPPPVSQGLLPAWSLPSALPKDAP